MLIGPLQFRKLWKVKILRVNVLFHLFIVSLFFKWNKKNYSSQIVTELQIHKSMPKRFNIENHSKNTTGFAIKTLAAGAVIILEIIDEYNYYFTKKKN